MLTDRRMLEEVAEIFDGPGAGLPTAHEQEQASGGDKEDADEKYPVEHIEGSRL
jgi:hypothetical protein